MLIPSSDEALRKREFAITLQFENRKKETYSIRTKPRRTSELVLASEKMILNNLSLREVAVGLNHSVDLIFVAYNLLAGKDIQATATVSGIQKSLLDATLEASVTMNHFKNKSAEVVDDAFGAYKWLGQGKESLAILQLQRCGNTVSQMADESEKLASRFQKIVDASQSAVEARIIEKVNDQNKRKALQETFSQIKILQTRTIELQKNIKSNLESVQKEYEEAREREKTEGDRAFITGIIGASIGALASGLGSVAQTVIAVKSPPGWLGAAGASAATNKPSDALIAEKTSLSQKLQEQQAAKTDIFIEKTTNDAEIAKAEKIINDPSAPAQSKEDAKKLQAAAQAKSANIDKRLKTAEEAVKTILSGLSGVSQQLQQISSQSYLAAETASKEKMAYYEHRNALANENREALASLAQSVVELKYTTDETESIVLAIKSLEFAIKALSGVVAALNQNTLFWRNMASYCKNNLANPNFVEDLTFIQNAFTLQERVDYYSSEEFIQMAVGNIAQWVALNNLCDRYIVAVTEVYGKVNKNNGSRFTNAQAEFTVHALRLSLIASSRNEQAAIDAEIVSFKLQMQSLVAQAARLQ